MGDPSRDSFGFDDDATDRGASLVSPLDWAKFVVGAVRRRWAVSTSLFLLILVAAAGYYRTKAPSYRVEATILSQPPPAIMWGGRAGADDLASRSAWEVIHRRDNLVA